jgi:hypothetical protein
MSKKNSELSNQTHETFQIMSFQKMSNGKEATVNRALEGSTYPG